MKKILLLFILGFISVAELSAQNATLYIARKSILGALIKFQVNVNDMNVGKLGSNQYFHCEVPAGNVKVTVSSENDGELIFETQPGGVYYVEAQVAMGVWKARVKLIMLNAIEGAEIVNNCKLLTASNWAASSTNAPQQIVPSTPIRTTPTVTPQSNYLAKVEEVTAHYNATKQSLIDVTHRQQELLLSSADREELGTINTLLSSANNSLYEIKTGAGNEKQKLEKLNKVEYVLGKIDERLNIKFGGSPQQYASNNTPAPTYNQQPTYTQPTYNNNNYNNTTTAPAMRNSDVDKNIPVTNKKADNTFVLVIANENYEFVDDVQFALNDGETFREYCIKTLGVPERQVWLYKDATAGIIAGGVDKMLQAMSIFDNCNVIVYYCGHGIPDESTGDAYIIPTDGKGTNTATCYSLNKLYKTLASANAKSVTYFMDACFTGANRDGSMLVAARGVAREAKKEVISGNTVVFSAASGDETAMPFKEKQHGLFTYFLLKKLQETKGNVTYGELAEYIKENVKKEAFLTNEKPQNPVVATSAASTATWRSLKF